MGLAFRRLVASHPVALSHVALLLANVIFGTGHVVSKVGLANVNPVVFALVREVISCPLLAVLSCISESGERPDEKLTESLTSRIKLLRYRLLFTGAALYGSNFGYIVGVKLSGPTTGAVWQSAQPVFMTLMAVALRLEKCSMLKALGIALAFVGCIVVSVEDAFADQHSVLELVLGNILLFLQIISISCFYVSQKPLLKKFRPVALLSTSYLVASVLMAISVVVYNNNVLLQLLCSDCTGQAWELPASSLLAIGYWY